MSQSRFSANLTVDGGLLGRLIGLRGCNIRRITQSVGAGCYIRGSGNTFKIEAYTEDAVRAAAKMLKEDEKALKNPGTISKPSTTFDVDPDVVPHIVGRNGIGIRQIMNKVGDGCWIVHRDGAFHISANSTDQVQHARALLNKNVKAFFQWRKEQELSKLPNSPVRHKDWMDGNTFAALASPSSALPSPCSTDEPVSLKIAEKPKLKGAWANTSNTQSRICSGDGESYDVSVPRDKWVSRKSTPKTIEVELDNDSDYQPHSPDYTPPPSPTTSVRELPKFHQGPVHKPAISNSRGCRSTDIEKEYDSENLNAYFKDMGFKNEEAFHEANFEAYIRSPHSNKNSGYNPDKLYI